ncbi:MAG: sugar phosphate nucleotidyltransferase [Steroidobacteraceae bacterium]
MLTTSSQHVWALVLAGGEGKRLRSLTTQPCGTAVPKQFCSLRGAHSLVEDAIDRAVTLADTERICAVVAAEHRHWWSESAGLSRLNANNLIVQPKNRGTAVGVLLGALQILARDPDALVVLLPADHYVEDEDVLHCSMVAALRRLQIDSRYPVLLGLEPDRPDTELGYILPGGRDLVGGQRVLRFIEKPNASLASEIISSGGLWNTFIIVASVQRLIDMYVPKWVEVLVEMRSIVDGIQSCQPELVEFYEHVPEIDFSRHLLEGQESSLRVVRVPSCGWNDLGTPRRVGETLGRLSPHDYAAAVSHLSSYVNIAAQYEGLRRLAQRGAKASQGSQ